MQPLGYFNDSHLERIEQVRRMKKRGSLWQKSSTRIGVKQGQLPDVRAVDCPKAAKASRGQPRGVRREESQRLQLTLDGLSDPAI